MVAHPKLKRTMIRGVRPIPGKQLTPPPHLQRETIEQMRKLLFEEVLVDGKSRAELTERQQFVADQAYLVILFHLGQKSFQDLQRHNDEGHKDEVGFKQDQIDSLNFVILEKKEEGQLETIFKKLEGKVGVK